LRAADDMQLRICEGTAALSSREAALARGAGRRARRMSNNQRKQGPAGVDERPRKGITYSLSSSSSSSACGSSSSSAAARTVRRVSSVGGAGRRWGAGGAGGRRARGAARRRGVRAESEKEATKHAACRTTASTGEAAVHGLVLAVVGCQTTSGPRVCEASHRVSKEREPGRRAKTRARWA